MDATRLIERDPYCLECRQRSFDMLSAADRDRLIAVHEAGHAIAHYYHQHIFSRMALGDEGGLVDIGRAVFVANAFFEGFQGDPSAAANLKRRNDYKVAAAVDMLVAGSIAECRHMQWAPAHLSAGDEALIDRILRHVEGESRVGEEAERQKRESVERISRLFERDGVWPAALAIADRLIAERELFGPDVFSRLREAGLPRTGLQEHMKAVADPR